MRATLLTMAMALILQTTASTPASAQTPASAKSSAGLTRLLEAELARFSGPGGPYRAGLYVKHLGTGEEAGVNASERFETASTVKLAVMVLAYQMADRKKLNLSERYVIKPSDIRGGSGIFRYNDIGLNPTIRDLIIQMIITSDNSATDIMIAKVGGVDAVNAWLAQSGYNTFRLNSTVYAFFRQRYDVLDPKYAKMSPEELYALGTDNPAFTNARRNYIDQVRDEADKSAVRVNDEMMRRRTDEKYWLGIVSPSDIGRMLEGIERDTIASKDACEEMKRIMRAQQAGTRKIPHYLNVPVAHKTGEVGGVTNDVGMVYARSGTIIMSFYTQGYTGLAAEADDRLGAVARLVVEYFDGAN